jgi:flavodoxin
VNVKVVYFSRTGNTKKVAHAIGEAVGVRAESVDGFRDDGDIDLVFVGGAVYADYDHGFSPAIQSFLGGLDPSRVKRVAIFDTYAFKSSIEKLASAVKSAGLNLAAERFSSRGKFLFFNARHPNEAELGRAKAFARAMLEP